MMEKIKLQLPDKYYIKIELTGKILKKDVKNCREVINELSNALRCACAVDFDELIRTSGDAVISSPLIFSIAESKMDFINDAFDHFSIPIRAFLEKESNGISKKKKDKR